MLLAVLQKTVVVSDTDGVESLTLRIIYQSQNDVVLLCTHYYKGPPGPSRAACLWVAAGRGRVSREKKKLFHSLLCIFAVLSALLFISSL